MLEPWAAGPVTARPQPGISPLDLTTMIFRESTPMSRHGTVTVSMASLIAGALLLTIDAAPWPGSRAGGAEKEKEKEQAKVKDRDADKPKSLKILMKKIDASNKALCAATATVAAFKKSGNGKEIAASATEMGRLGKETRGFKEPSEAMKKPYDKWVDMNDRFVAAAEELAQIASKGDLVGSRKAYSTLNLTCSNCHGAFRPSVDDGF